MIRGARNSRVDAGKMGCEYARRLQSEINAGYFAHDSPPTSPNSRPNNLARTTYCWRDRRAARAPESPPGRAKLTHPFLLSVKFLEVIKPFCSILPEIAKPQRKVRPPARRAVYFHLSRVFTVPCTVFPKFLDRPRACVSAGRDGMLPTICL